MVWISLVLVAFIAQAKDFPKFLTKHAIESVRFMSKDGRYAYVTKKAGVLGMVSSFRSVDFISEPNTSDFTVQGSRFQKRLVIEVIPNLHNELNVIKPHKIFVVDFGNTQSREVGKGINAKLHVLDEWLTYYQPMERTIQVRNLLTDRSYAVKLSPKLNPFFVPEVEMVSGESIIYTETSDKGHVSLVNYSLSTQRSTVIYRSPHTGTHLSLCQDKGHLTFGEFPYDDIARESTIMTVKVTSGTNLAGFSTIYNSNDGDIGNLVCTENSVYFIKSLVTVKAMNHKTTELARLDLKTSRVEALTELGSVTQVINMDGRIMVPFRGDFHVIEGDHNLSDDKLKEKPVDRKEELQLEI